MFTNWFSDYSLGRETLKECWGFWTLYTKWCNANLKRWKKPVSLKLTVAIWLKPTNCVKNIERQVFRTILPATSWLNWTNFFSGNTRDLNQAWDLYYHVFRRISRQLPQLTSLELHYVSPNLLKCQDLELAVPGSYAPGQPIVRIAHFQRSLEVCVLDCFIIFFIVIWGA